MIFIKTSHTTTVSTEVHVASAASNYQEIVYDSGSLFPEGTNGFCSLTPETGEMFEVSDGDQTFIDLKSDGNDRGSAQVVIASKDTNSTRVLLGLPISLPADSNGVWQLIDFNGV